MIFKLIVAFILAATLVSCDNDKPRCTDFSIGIQTASNGPPVISPGETVVVFLDHSCSEGDPARLGCTWSAEPSPDCQFALDSPGQHRTKLTVLPGCSSSSVHVSVEITTPGESPVDRSREIAIQKVVRDTAPHPSPAPPPRPAPDVKDRNDILKIIPDLVSRTTTLPAGAGTSAVTVTQHGDRSYEIKIDTSRPGTGSTAACWELSRETTIPANHVLVFTMRAHRSGDYAFTFGQAAPDGASTTLNKRLKDRNDWLTLPIRATDLATKVASGLGRICIGVERMGKASPMSFDLREVILRVAPETVQIWGPGVPIVKPAIFPTAEKYPLPAPSCGWGANDCKRPSKH